MQSISPSPSVLDFDGLRPPSPYMNEAHAHWRALMRDFVTREIEPNLDAWEAAGTFPDALYESAARQGLLGVGFPERIGGHTEDADPYYRVIFAEEMHRLGSGVVFADLATHWIGLPPVVQFGSEELLETVARPVLAGKRRIAFAVTEPSGGSDAGSLRTRAERRDDHWLVNGSKTLISGAMRSDRVLAAVRTGSAGAGGISLLLIDAESAGIERRLVPGLRWYNASIGTLEFRDVRVPLDRLIGVENRGFCGAGPAVQRRAFERVAATLAMSRAAVAEAIAWHKSARRSASGWSSTRPCATSWLTSCVGSRSLTHTRINASGGCSAAMQLSPTSRCSRCRRRAHSSGAPATPCTCSPAQAYTPGTTRVERIYREAPIFSIGGGTEEILRIPPSASSELFDLPTLRHARGKIDVTDEQTLQNKTQLNEAGSRKKRIAMPAIPTPSSPSTTSRWSTSSPSVWPVPNATSRRSPRRPRRRFDHDAGHERGVEVTEAAAPARARLAVGSKSMGFGQPAGRKTRRSHGWWTCKRWSRRRRRWHDDGVAQRPDDLYRDDRVSIPM